MTPNEQRRARAINAIIDALRGDGIKLGIDLTPIAERVYRQAGREVMEAWQSDMREADRW